MIKEVLGYLWGSGIIYYLLVLVVLLVFVKKESLKINLKIKKKDLKFTMVVLMSLLSLTVILASLGLIGLNMPQNNSKEILITLVSVALVVAPTEEILFRGTMQNLLTKKWGLLVGIGITSIIFGLIHLRFGMFFAILTGITGLAMGMTYNKTESILHPIIVHTVMALTWIMFLKI